MVEVAESGTPPRTTSLDKKVVVGEFFEFLKTRGGELQCEFFNVEDALNKWGSKYISHGIALELKIPGERVQVHKLGGKPQLLSTSGIDKLGRLPELKTDLDRLPDGVALDAELLILFKGKPVSQPDMNTFLRSKDPPEPESWSPRLYIFDALSMDGHDLHLEPWTVRQDALTKLWPDDTQYVKRVRPSVVTDAESFRKAAEAIQRDPITEGVMLKVATSQYQLGRRTVKWAKVKDTATIKARVSSREKKTGGDPWTMFFYGLKLADGTDLGKSYGTSLDTGVGSVVEVTISGIEKGDQGWQVYDPIIVGRASGQPDSSARLAHLMQVGFKMQRLKKKMNFDFEFLDKQLTFPDAEPLSPEDLQGKPVNPRRRIRALVSLLDDLGLTGRIHARDVIDTADEFTKLRLVEMIPDVLRKVPDEEVLQAHHRLHQLAGGNYTSWENLVNFHVFVTREMELRGLDHNPHDKLDKDSIEWQAETRAEDEAKAKAESEQAKSQELSEEEVLKGMNLAEIDFEEMDHAILVPDFVSISGSSVYKAEPNDIDVVIRADELPATWRIRLEQELGAAGIETYHAVFSREGPHGPTVLPLYHLALMRAPFRVKSYEIAKAELKPGVQNFKPLKTSGGYGTLEFAAAEPAWETWASGFEQGVAVEEKYDGWRINAHRSGDDIKIFSEDAKQDLSPKLESIAAALKGLPDGDFVLDGELLLHTHEAVTVGPRQYRKGEKVQRMDMTSFLSQNPPAAYDSEIAVFDIIYSGTEDLHAQPWSERQTALSKLLPSNKPGLLRVQPIIARTQAAFTRAVQIQRSKPDSEGAMLKVVDSDYPLSGQSRQIAKVKNFKEIRVKVSDKEEKEGGNIYVGVLSDGTQIGRTYITDLDANVGDILEVRVAEIKIGEGGKLTWDNPIPASVKPAGTAVTTPDQAQALAAAKRSFAKQLNELVLTFSGPDLLIESGEARVYLSAGGPLPEPDPVPDVILTARFNKKAKAQAGQIGADYTVGTYAADGLRVTPEKLGNVFAYKVEGSGLKIAYAPLADEFPAAVVKEADVAVLGGSDPAGLQRRAKAVGANRILFVNTQPAEGIDVVSNGQQIRLVQKASALAAIAFETPFGQRVIDQAVELIVKDRAFTGYIDEPLAVLEGDIALGVIRLGEPVAIDEQAFEELKSLHRITLEERMQWWPKAEVLYAYSFEVLEKFSPTIPLGQSNPPQYPMPFIRHVTLKSSDEGDGKETRGAAATKFWEENWENILPKSGKGEFIYHHHYRGLPPDLVTSNEAQLQETNHSVHGDLRMEGAGGDAWGFTVFLGETAAVRQAGGDRLENLPYNDALQGTFKFQQPRAWLKVGLKKPFVSGPGEVGSTSGKTAKFFAYDHGTYEVTYARLHTFEIFLHGRHLKGRYMIRFVPTSGGNRVWQIARMESQTPFTVEHADEKDQIISEIRSKSQQFLVWGKPGTKPEFIDVTRRQEAAKDFYYDILKANKPDRYTLGIVYAPNEIDLQNNFARERTIELACWAFGATSLTAGDEHVRFDNMPGVVVENYISRVPMKLGDQDVPTGSWLLGVVWNEDMWARIQRGAVTGYSLGGYSDVIDRSMDEFKSIASKSQPQS